MAEGGVTVKQEPVEAVELESRFAVLCNRSYKSPVSVGDWKLTLHRPVLHNLGPQWIEWNTGVLILSLSHTSGGST